MSRFIHVAPERQGDLDTTLDHRGSVACAVADLVNVKAAGPEQPHDTRYDQVDRGQDVDVRNGCAGPSAGGDSNLPRQGLLYPPHELFLLWRETWNHPDSGLTRVDRRLVHMSNATDRD